MKNLFIIVFSALIFLGIFYGVASAQLVTANKGGTLQGNIIISDNPQFISDWLNPAMEVPDVKGIKTAQPNQKLTAAFLISGLKLDEKRAYRASVSFKLLQPNGHPMFGQDNYAFVKGQAPAKYVDILDAFIMANPALDMVLEPSDPKGVYTLEAVITDQVADSKTKAQYSFILQ